MVTTSSASPSLTAAASSSSKRMTRSQTASVLGKRSGAPLSRSPSLASLNSASSSSLLTPETTPDAKKPRTTAGVENDDGTANKENVPPIREVVMETPLSRRLTRRSTMDAPTLSPTRTIRTPRRRATELSIPQTPTSAVEQLSLQTPPPTPPTLLPLHVRARACLRATSNAGHVAMSIEGREKESTLINDFLREFASSSRHSDESDASANSVLYISGSPGTGKTALVNSILSSLSLDQDFISVKRILVNCMAFQSVDALWVRLAEELMLSVRRGKTASGKLSSRECVTEFLEQNNDVKCILILDELDHLSSINASALQPLFRLAVQHPSAIRIIGIANTHTLTASSSSSIAFDHLISITNDNAVQTIHFAPYKPAELLSILNKRLESLPQEDLKKMIPQPALLLLTKKVASLTGDVRVLFEVLRGAIELAAPASTPSNASAKSLTTEVSSPAVIVTPTHILAALKLHSPSSTPSNSSKSKSNSVVAASGTAPTAAANSEIVMKVKALGLQHRLVLLSLLLATKRLTSGLSITGSSSSSFPSSTPTSSPTKRSPIKRTQSSTLNFESSSSSSSESGIDNNALFAFYARVLQDADTFSPASRSDFTDILGVLETTGLVALTSSTSAGRTKSPFKRSSSFTSRASMSASSSGQGVKLQSEVREAEVTRGLGLPSQGANGVVGDASVGGDPMLEEVRTIWMREVGKVKKEKEAIARRAVMDGVDVFDDAMDG